MSLTVLSFTKHSLMLKFNDAGKGIGKNTISLIIASY